MILEIDKDFRHYHDFYLGFPSNIDNSEPSPSQTTKGMCLQHKQSTGVGETQNAT
jgi:hypothetical protein